ncbi:MAG: dienelactone hydrolase family protein [Myxococcales bacterium]|nr:dienelactone hydrolase family protein [Myxococcales bacterium]
MTTPRIAVISALAALVLVACSDDSSTSGADAGDARPADAAPGETAPGEAGAGDTGPAACIDDTSAGHHQYICDGLKFDVHIPAACTPSGASCGLVLDVHGLSMNAQMEDANTNMRALGEKHGYVVVQPTAPGVLPSWDPKLHDERVHDFLTLAITRLGVDTKRVHMTGFSQGGYMSWRFICKFTDTFASVAPAAACGSAAIVSGCTFNGNDVPKRKLPILFMHGTKDALVPFNGCADTQRDAVIAHYNAKVDKVIADDATHVWTRYVGAGGERFEFIQHDYASNQALIVGHCFPGSTDPGGAKGQAFSFKCDDASQAFVWGEVAMQFFIETPRP